MESNILQVIPVLPSQNIDRDVTWHNQYTGFEVYYQDSMYAVLFRESFVIHLQWHADTESDPLLGGSVIRIQVKNIQSIFDEFVQRGTINHDGLKTNTPWQTNEFGFFDLNKNAIFIAEDLSNNQNSNEQ